ncbi:antigen 5 like allergen Cul n 1-like isoform X2 [Toxorhynchites rutilus septentrionalis]|uniref:antigen 5 like allergen Cul n 1-like isoform X2 n=1 Tax=Toxorhynchites rutilus septentrionalis TaxID=329112 RepID=UPI0024784DCF|nr:antigen 5 like allergen Cul n 1-like isoform X2 [Toxorhynchites rutilus septentrionalis]
MDVANYGRLTSTLSSRRRVRCARSLFFLLFTSIVQHISATDDRVDYYVDYEETSAGITAEETTTEQIFSTTSSQSENDFYCREDLCLQYDQFGELVRKTHVACGHDGSFAEDCPAGRTLFKIDPQIQAFIIHLHNDARNRLANGSLEGFESALRMPSVVWNDELAKLAEINTKSCKFEHDECRNTEQYRIAGQNLALGYYAVETDIFDILEKLTALWFKEYRDANQTLMDVYEKPQNVTVGHFTQMMSDRTTSIGCGIVIYPHKVPGYTFKVVLFACNYSITSITGQPVYRKGPAGIKCEFGVNPYYNGLCSTEENLLIKSNPFYDE